jgi:sugar-specific transcriptional regulator TrmB
VVAIITTSFLLLGVLALFMDLSIIENAGLTKTESKVYVTLLESGGSPAGVITRKSGIHRRSVYDALERLREKGLVTTRKENNLTLYSGVSPDRLLDIIREKESSLANKLPDLKALFQEHENDDVVSFFRGNQALRSLFNDQLQTKKPISVLNASLNAADVVKFYFERFDNERKKNKITMRLIFDESARKNAYVKKIPLAEIRYLPESYKNPTAVNIYGDKVAIILWSDKPLAVLINNKVIADSYRQHFTWAWSIARK